MGTLFELWAKTILFLDWWAKRLSRHSHIVCHTNNKGTKQQKIKLTTKLKIQPKNKSYFKYVRQDYYAFLLAKASKFGIILVVAIIKTDLRCAFLN